jgi:hypothetical protein
MRTLAWGGYARDVREGCGNRVRGTLRFGLLAIRGIEGETPTSVGEFLATMPPRWLCRGC